MPRKPDFIRKVWIRTNKKTLAISIPSSLAHVAGIGLGTKVQWSIQGRILSLRVIRMEHANADTELVKIWRSPEWKKVKDAFIARHGRCCKLCGETNGVTPHHIKNGSYLDFENNCILVCRSCHFKLHSCRNSLQPSNSFS